VIENAFVSASAEMDGIRNSSAIYFQLQTPSEHCSYLYSTVDSEYVLLRESLPHVLGDFLLCILGIYIVFYFFRDHSGRK
jgi:hypothetical protein